MKNETPVPEGERPLLADRPYAVRIGTEQHIVYRFEPFPTERRRGRWVEETRVAPDEIATADYEGVRWVESDGDIWLFAEDVSER